MKKLTLILLFLSCINLIAKKDDDILPKNAEGKVIYIEVVEVKGATADKLYSRALGWFEKTFGWQKWQRKEQGLIGATMVFEAVRQSDVRYFIGLVGYRIEFFAEEGQYKYEITDPKHDGWDSGYGSGGDLSDEKPDCGEECSITKEIWILIKKQTDKHVRALIDSLKAAMLKSME
jgi:hypothetical protein